MKTVYCSFAGIVLLALATSCHDRAAEKKIAELETRIAQMESKSGGTAAPSAGVPVTPSATPAQPVVAEEKPAGPLPVIEFNELEHDFGTVAEGQKVTFEYRVKNTGQVPLIIESAQPSCGCTVPNWTKEPIAIGGTGFVKAEFDTNHKTGAQNKSITVTSNTWPKTTILKFKGMVTAKAQ